MNSQTKNRRTTLVVGITLLLALMAGAHVVKPPPAAALTGLVKVPALSATDSVSPKTVRATCPAGKRVVGGGGWAFAIAAADDAKVMLTQLEPVRTDGLDRYVVSGTEVAPGMTGNWWLEGYVLCANAPAGYEVVSASTALSSSPTHQTAAVCPGNKQVIGTGSRINNGAGQVTLQLSRSSGPRDISRVTAKEDANGYSGIWNATSFALCTNPLANFSAVFNGSTQTGSQSPKVEIVTCPSGTFVHSAGAAISGVPPGLATGPPGVAIQVIYPFNNKTQVQVAAVETTPTNASWDLAAQAICGP